MPGGEPMGTVLPDGDGDAGGDADGDRDADELDADERDADELDVDAVRPENGDGDAVVIPAEHAARETPATQAVTAATVRRIGVVIGCLPSVLFGATAQG
jgi:hypothetical protein